MTWLRRPWAATFAVAVIAVVVLLIIAGAVRRQPSAGSLPGRRSPPSALPSPRPTPSASPVVIPAGHVPILMYHYIRVNPNPRDRFGFSLSVTPANLQRQMQWAHDHGFHTVTMAALEQALATGITLDDHSFILTFDDGYADFYTAAIPLLKRFGFTATAYVVPGFIGRPGYMTWDQVASLDRMGINIGSHSLTHPDLTLQTPGRAQAQIAGSKVELESRLGHRVDDFCYPSGRFNPAVVELVRQAGYRDATTTAFGTFEALDTALYWPRVRIEGADTLDSFATKIRNGIATYAKYGDAPPPNVFPSPLLAPSPLTPSPGGPPATLSSPARPDA